jgi:ribose/xylose/arabinose/galactoside ABC-type transport system permease subunit
MVCGRPGGQAWLPVSRPGTDQRVHHLQGKILPFIATLATMLAASGSRCCSQTSNRCRLPTIPTSWCSARATSPYAPEWVNGEDAGSLAPSSAFSGFPIPAWIALFAYLFGSLILNRTAFGRHVLAVGGGEEASRLMGLPTDRTIFLVYVMRLLAGIAGVILASQFGAGQPIEGVGWELFAIASVVVGGTLLTGGSGSVVDATLVGTCCCSASCSPSSTSKTAWVGSASRLLAVGAPRGSSCSSS